MYQSFVRPEAQNYRRVERSPLALLRREMDEIVDNFFGGRGVISSLGTETALKIDLVETDSALEVTTDLPGYQPSEVQIDVVNDHLTISGQHVEEQQGEKEGRKYHRMERRSGSFSRTIWLPCAVEDEAIEAGLKNGVLTVKLPKAKPEIKKKISVKAEG